MLRFIASEVPLYTRNPKNDIHENPTHRNLTNKNNERSRTNHEPSTMTGTLKTRNPIPYTLGTET